MALSKHHTNGNVEFHFFGDLYHFLSKKSNGRVLYNITYTVSIKDAIEAIGVPHVEIGKLIRNNKALTFKYLLQPGDCIEVYPECYAANERTNNILRPPLSLPLRFILDVHLGSLARLLRLMGFDTLYETAADDVTIAQTAASENRIVLTRDVGLLKHRIIEWGYWIRSQYKEQQFLEVANRFDLWNSFAPFTHCLACNGQIKAVNKDQVLSCIPLNASLYFQSFFQCNNCQRVFWKGSHYEKMLQTIERIRNLKAA